MKTEDCSIPIGADFLPDTSRQYLVQCQKNEKKAKVKMRLLVYIMRKDGKTIHNIGRDLNIPYSTVRCWLKRVTEKGIHGRYDKKIPGAPPKLDDQQIKQLKMDLKAGPQACGLDHGVWTAPVIIKHIKKRFGATYAPTGIYELLRRINFSWQAPRAMNPKSASKKEQKEFKKKPRRLSSTI